MAWKIDPKKASPASTIEPGHPAVNCEACGKPIPSEIAYASVSGKAVHGRPSCLYTLAPKQSN